MSRNRRPRREFALVALCCAQLVTTIDVFIVNLALPTMARDLDASTAQLQWVVDAFTLTIAATMPVGGWLADRFGRRRVLMIGLALLGLSSIPAAFASDAGVVIFARGLQGMACGACSPATVAMITAMYPDLRERGRAIGYWATVASVGVALGPILGGYLLANYWWGSVFLINPPIILAVILGLALWAPESSDPDPDGIDTMAPALSIAALVLVLWGVIGAPDRGWGDPLTLGSIAAGVAVSVLFVHRELRHRAPMIDLRLLAISSFAIPTVVMICAQSAQAGFIFLASISLQDLLGYGPLRAGMAFLPFAVVSMTGGVLSPRLAVRFGARSVMIGGLVAIAAGLLVSMTIAPGGGYLPVGLAMFFVGGGITYGFTTGLHLSLSRVPAARLGMAAGASASLRQTGMALGVAVTGSLLSAGYRSHLSLDGLGLGAHDSATASESLRQARNVAADGVAGSSPDVLLHRASNAFEHGMRLGLLAVCGVIVVALVVALLFIHDDVREADVVHLSLAVVE